MNVVRREIVSKGARPWGLIYGHSTETKPTDFCGGSKFVETDTGKKFRYDELGGKWKVTTR